jgi:hypothetical protein
MKPVLLITFCQLYFIGFFVVLTSCEKENMPENIPDSQDTIIYTDYREDATYAEGPDLSHNLEEFDQEKLKRAIEAFRDREFRKGMILWSPVQGSLVKDTILTFGYPESQTTNPYWTIAQWASKYSLKNHNFEILENGDRVYRNVAKTLSTNPDGSFQLELKGKQEWGEHVKQPGESWPHLYLQQSIYPEVQIPVARCENIYFSLDGIREYCYNYMSEDVDLRNHTAHVVINIIIQNRNKQSPLHGKYYIIKLPCYDYRYDFAPKVNAYDIGGKEFFTGALMYGMPGENLWNGTFKDGKWHKARKDILPLILEGWPVATQPGTPLEGADMNDFYLSAVNMGWEVSGIFDASMRFKNYSIKAVITP